MRRILPDRGRLRRAADAAMPVSRRDPPGCLAPGRPGRHQPLDLGPRRLERLASPPRPQPRGVPPGHAADDQHEFAARRDRAVAAPPRPARPSVPRTIVSWSLVSSRQTAPRPLAAARRSQVAQRRRDPPRRLEQRPSPARRRRSGASRSRRSRPLRGRNPSNAQRGPATPLAATAASTADAPGIGTTRPPSAAQAATSSAARVADGRACRHR